MVLGVVCLAKHQERAQKYPTSRRFRQGQSGTWLKPSCCQRAFCQQSTSRLDKLYGYQAKKSIVRGQEPKEPRRKAGRRRRASSGGYG